MLEEYTYDETPSGRTDTLIKTIEELERTKKLYARAKWWLNEIINNHRYTPVSTAEMAVKDLGEKENE